jgi:hypothetical protein
MVSTPLAVVVTILFSAAALFSVARLAKSRSPVTRANYGLHLLMSLAMIAMAWRDTIAAPAVQTAVFGGGTLWFVVRALIRRHARRGPALDLYHAVMMAVMTVMVLSMGDGMSHDGRLAAALAAAGGFFAVAAIMWALLLVRRRHGAPPSRLRANLTREAVYELAMAAGMAVMALSQ